jgi:membrane protein implicated in regulation of membrane protease activity
MEWSDYWVWFAAAIVLGILEVLAPGYILLGFALAAGVMGVGLWMGGGVGAFLATSLPVTLVIFAVISIILWLVMRKVFGSRTGSVKVWDTDINEN